MREIPRGAMSRREATLFVRRRVGGRSSSPSWQLNAICALLSPVALAIVFWYSLAKRYTTYTQAFLGLAMAVAPVGGWLAAGGASAAGSRGCSAWRSALWVGGFDILYACQDLDFDRAHGLRSIPVRFGIARSLLDLARDARRRRRLHGGARLARAARPRLSRRRRARGGALDLRAVARVSAHDLSQVKRAFDLNG